jgi:acetoacetyl-CoA synthetase
MSSLYPTPQLRLYQTWLETQRGLRFDSYQDLWRWSVTDLEGFWRSIWEYEAIESPTRFEAALCVDRMPGGVWFNGATVNYARQVFRHIEAAHAAGQPAVISENELGEIRELSWPQLRNQAASLALTLRALGVGRGDRVAAYLSNGPEAAVSFLACASLGAVWSLCAPDMGAQAIIDRFSQIQPKVFIAVDGVHYAGKPSDRSAMIVQLQTALPTLRATVVQETPYALRRLPGALSFTDATSRSDHEVLEFEPEWLPFDHPLWVLYSSGTTGLPKPIVQGHGGVLVTSMASGKHIDLGPSYAVETLGERFHWFTSTGWVMWNAQLGGLLGGTTICLYDGSPFGSRENPDWRVLWRFASRHRVTFFGSGAAFFGNCMKASVSLSDCGDLSSIRALGSTGSPLPSDVQNWGTQQFESIGTANIWWCNISGGTDLGGTFCTGNRELPQTPGEMQCRQIGAAVEAWNDAGQSVIDEVGELVCVRPIPAMPLYFWGDEDGRRYRSSYFETYPGIWRHGDWIKITPSGSCIIYGRSDATINRHGVRMGTSEVYAAVEALNEITDSLALDLEYLGKESRLLLFVVLRPALSLDETLKSKICDSIRRNLSPRFIPDEIVQAPEVPRTLSGKKQEVPLKKLFLGQPPEKIINRAVMANPASIDWYLAYIRAHS